MKQTIAILGINGRIGQETARAFVAANWRVIGMGRSNRAGLAGVEFMEGDVDRPEQMARAIAGADVVFNALNLPYHKWENGRAEAQLAKVLSAMKGSGKTLIFPGNIYNYAEHQHLITPDTPQRPPREKGEIRKRMEGLLAEASQNDDIQVLILRLGDFFAPGAKGTMFDLVMLGRLKSGIVQFPAELSIAHSWAYLPDAARALVKIAEERAQLPKFENFHFAGHFVTGQRMVDAIGATLRTPVRIKQIPWKLLGFLGLFIPLLRETMKMRYLWNQPHRMQDSRLDDLLGPDFDTPFEEAVAATVRSYVPVDKQAPVPKATDPGHEMNSKSKVGTDGLGRPAFLP